MANHYLGEGPRVIEQDLCLMCGVNEAQPETGICRSKNCNKGFKGQKKKQEEK
jgi:hypothetical protein